jgi:hypothetical protein
LAKKDLSGVLYAIICFGGASLPTRNLRRSEMDFECDVCGELQEEINGMERTIDELEAAIPRWISVEQPPEDDGWYIVCFARTYNKTYKQTVTSACWINGEWIRNQTPSTERMPATHWMEKPAPPVV